METIELHLDAKTLEKARWLAEHHHLELAEIVTQAIEKLAASEAQSYPLLGLFADDPASVDEMMESVMSDRANLSESNP